MINKSDLRDGIWVRSIHTGYVQVSLFMIGEIADDETYLDHLMPIPLNPEMLEKAGFERNEREDWDGDLFYVWYKNGVDIHENWDATQFLYATYVKGESRSFKGGIQVKYVHHLQNIFHALTNSELNITLQ